MEAGKQSAQVQHLKKKLQTGSFPASASSLFWGTECFKDYISLTSNSWLKFHVFIIWSPDQGIFLDAEDQDNISGDVTVVSTLGIWAQHLNLRGGHIYVQIKLWVSSLASMMSQVLANQHHPQSASAAWRLHELNAMKGLRNTAYHCINIMDSVIIMNDSYFAPSSFKTQRGVGVATECHWNKLVKHWKQSPTLSDQNCSWPGSTKRPRAGRLEGWREAEGNTSACVQNFLCREAAKLAPSFLPAN